jgi:hypothetical protein
MVSFNLRLEDSYWSKGFFNVPVDFERFITSTDGPCDLFLGDSATAFTGRIDRTANANATPRIIGNKPLADFFKVNHRRGAFVRVEILSPTAVRIGGRP